MLRVCLFFDKPGTRAFSPIDKRQRDHNTNTSGALVFLGGLGLQPGPLSWQAGTLPAELFSGPYNLKVYIPLWVLFFIYPMDCLALNIFAFFQNYYVKLFAICD